MTLYKLRVKLPDRPGALAAVAQVLADTGGNIEAFDIHEVNGATVEDEFLVRLPGLTALDELFRRMRTAGALQVSATRTARHNPADRVVVALSGAAALLEARDRATLLAALGEAVRALVPDVQVQFVGDSEAEADPIARRALSAPAGAVRERRDTPRPEWVLAVRDPGGTGLVCVLRRRYNVGFSTADAQRVRALLRVAALVTDPCCGRTEAAAYA